jgi:hypothetical protein
MPAWIFAFDTDFIASWDLEVVAAVSGVICLGWLVAQFMRRQRIVRHAVHLASGKQALDRRSNFGNDAATDDESDRIEDEGGDPVREFARLRGSEVFVFAFQHPSSAQKYPLTPDSVRYFLHTLRSVQQRDEHAKIDVILHSPLVNHATEQPYFLSMAIQIARALKNHKGPTTVFVPFYANQYTALIAFAAKQLVLGDNASLCFVEGKAALMSAAIKSKWRRDVEDVVLLAHHTNDRVMSETSEYVCELLHDGNHRGSCRLGREMAEGKYYYTNPINGTNAAEIGLPIAATSQETLEAAYNVILYGDTGLPAPQPKAQEPKEVAEAIEIDCGVCSATCHIGIKPHMRKLESRRNTKALCIIHEDGMREENVGLVSAVEILDFLRSTAPDQSLDIILHSPGGNALHGLQIARALKTHKGKVTVFVPYFAYSAGTIIALAADEIVMSPQAVLGPIDVQTGIEVPEIGGGVVTAPASAFISLKRQKPKSKIYTSLLAHADYCAEFEKQHHKNMVELMVGTYSRRHANHIVHTLNNGKLSHGYPITFQKAKSLGLKVSDQMPDEPMDIVEYFRGDTSEFCSVIHCSS